MLLRKYALFRNIIGFHLLFPILRNILMLYVVALWVEGQVVGYEKWVTK